METLSQNLRFARRQLGRNPGFTLTVVFTLALSIGANTAIFSIVDALMLKSLPYAHPERLGVIYERATGPHPSQDRIDLDGEQWESLRDNVPSLISAVSAGQASGVNLEAGPQNPVTFHAARISARYLTFLAFNRFWAGVYCEGRTPTGQEAILSYDLWRTTFGANPNLLGQTIHLKGEPYTVIGVLPQGAVTPSNADVYTALHPAAKARDKARISTSSTRCGTAPPGNRPTPRSIVPGPPRPRALLPMPPAHSSPITPFPCKKVRQKIFVPRRSLSCWPPASSC